MKKVKKHKNKGKKNKKAKKEMPLPHRSTTPPNTSTSSTVK
jgi:hypothetical protein